jgi:hypothetical protein
MGSAGVTTAGDSILQTPARGRAVHVLAPRVYRLDHWVTDSASDAEDVVQSVFLHCRSGGGSRD